MRVELNGGVQLIVFGTLIAIGAIFTWADGQNQWNGLIFSGAGSSNSRLENCVIEHAKDSQYAGEIIRIESSSLIIAGCTINNSAASQGIWVNNGSPVINNNTINGMSNYGILVYSNSFPTVTGNTITNNQYGIKTFGGGIYQSNTITENSCYGLYYFGSTILVATNNNWGDPSGPLDDSDDRASGGSYNPDGKGNKVSDQVKYYPWIGSTAVMGDISNDGKVDLQDAIRALQVLSGLNPPDIRPDYSISGADVDGNDKIGFAEVIYILQKVSEMR